jgi:hypothetical protein
VEVKVYFGIDGCNNQTNYLRSFGIQTVENLEDSAPSERNASEADLTIKLNLMLKKVDAALTEAVIIGANCAPSEFEIRTNLTAY